MNVGEIFTRVKRTFGDESGVQVTDEDIVRWINDAQREISIHNELLQVKGTANLVSGTSDVALPADILSLRSIRYLGEKLIPVPQKEVDDYLDGSTAKTGVPTHFWIWANTLTLYPTPNTSVVNGLSIYYLRHPVAVAASNDVPELPLQYHGRIVEYCLAQAHELDDNWEAANIKSSQFQRGVDELKDNITWQPRDEYPSITSTDEDRDYAW